MKNSELKNQALAALKGNWGQGVLVALIYFAIATGLSLSFNLNSDASCAENPFMAMFTPRYGIYFGANAFITIPIVYGMCVYFLKLLRKSELNISILFDGFKDYIIVLGTMLLVVLYTYLWLLLFIIPGIIKSLSYAMTPFILADNPDMKNNKAIELSMKMMHGYKMKLFWLSLSFIGWIILCILTLGIGFLWLIPYAQTSMAAFYEDVKANYVVE